MSILKRPIELIIVLIFLFTSISFTSTTVFEKTNSETHAFSSKNSQNGLKVDYRMRGFRVTPINTASSMWAADLELEAIHKGQKSLAMLREGADSLWKTHQDTLIASHPAFDIEYIHNDNGMRQNFIVRQKPMGIEKLKLQLSVQGTVKAIKKNDKDVVLAEWNKLRGQYRIKMMYRDLHVWDAKGIVLPANVEVLADGNQIALVVDDTKAVYPITVDPISNTPEQIIWGSKITDQFGKKVVGLGDVNGDGYSDIAVSVPYENDSKSVYLFYGSANRFSNIPSVKLNLVGYGLGSSIGSAGDVNNDGYKDVIVGATDFGSGVAYLYLGSASGISEDPAITLSCSGMCSGLKDAFGSSVGSAGDVNHDGYDDVLITAANYSNGQNNEGAFFIYLGNATGISTTPSTKFESNIIDAYLGATASGIGDVNHDGFDDIALSSYGSQLSTKGRDPFWVFYGSSTGISNIPSHKAYPGNSHFWARNLGKVGDINGDGVDDLVTGSSYSGGVGYIYVYYGKNGGLDSIPNKIIPAYQSGSTFGAVIDGGGDFNGDGYNDVLVGAPAYDGGQDNEGAVFVYFGSGIGIDSSRFDIISGGRFDLRMGESLCNLGDINKDGKLDFAVGIPRNGYGSYGGVYIYTADKGIPKLLEPLDGVYRVDSVVTLKWKSDASVSSYQLQISTDSNFASKTVDDSMVITSYFNYTSFSLDTTYYWRVRSINNNVKTEWSDRFKFIVLADSILPPKIVSPINGVRNFLFSQEFTISPIKYAQHYEYSVVDENGNGNGGGGVIPKFYLTIRKADSRLIATARALVFGKYTGYSEPCTVYTASASVKQKEPIFDKQFSTPTVRFNWDKINIDGNDSIRIVIVSDTMGPAEKDTISYNRDWIDVSGLRDSTHYYWKIYYKGISPAWLVSKEWWSFSTDFIKPVQPVNGAIDQPQTVQFKWHAVEQGGYVVMVAVDSVFTNPIKSRVVWSDTASSTNISIPNGQTKYFWKVYPYADTTYKSPVFSFTTKKFPPTKPILLAPYDSQMNVSISPIFSWRTDTSTTISRLQVSKRSQMDTLVIDTLVNRIHATSINGLYIDSLKYSGLQKDVRYYWRVQSSNEEGMSVWTETYSFKTILPDIVNIPSQFALKFSAQNGKNGMLMYALPKQSNVQVRVYALSGKKVFDRFLASQQAGYHSLAIDSYKQMNNAQYILEFIAGEFVARQKFVVLK